MTRYKRKGLAITAKPNPIQLKTVKIFSLYNINESQRYVKERFNKLLNINSIDYNNINHFYNADLLSAECNSKYPLYEFYLSAIDSILEESIELHYKLIHPISDRVEMLKGVIKEPFSRKDYMGYHKIASATASLDLKKAVEKGILIIEGDKRNARYRYRVETGVIFL